MFEYLKQVIADATGNPRSNVFISVLAGITLCTGFLFSVGFLVTGNAISDAVVLGLAGIIAGLAGHNYRVAKKQETK
jgi:hypothetical protein